VRHRQWINKSNTPKSTIRTHTYQLFKEGWRQLKGKDRYTWQWGASIDVSCDQADTEQQAIRNVIEQLEEVIVSLNLAALAQKEKHTRN